MNTSDSLIYVGSLTLSCMGVTHTYLPNQIWLFSLVNVSHTDLIIRLDGKT